MLKEIQRPHSRAPGPIVDSDRGESFSIPPRFSSLKRHKRLIFRVTACFALLAVLFAIFRHDSYTAVTKLLIDNKSLQLSRQDAVFARSEVDVPLIQNQIELLRSENIASRVIEDFKLADDPEFAAPRGPLGSPLLIPPDPENGRRLALESFKRRLYVGRVGDSYTLEIRFTAGKPEQAANIANKIGAEYISLVAQANAKVAQSASLWLRTRLEDMGPNASVITTATPPIRKDGPSSLVVLGAALLTGLMFGITGAFAADVMDHTIRTPEQASSVTRAECFGIVPLMKGRNLTFEAMRHPRSYLAHTIRRAIAAIREQPDVKIVGVTSAIPGEGKTTIAANLAHLAAASGIRVLLVDAVTYGGKLSSLLAPEAQQGLAEVLRKNVPFADLLWTISGTNLKLLPLGGADMAAFNPSGGLSGMQYVLLEAAALFDLIIVDLPPTTLVADVREAAAGFDGFLLVAEWGKTSLDVVEAAIGGNEQIRQRLLGVILNKTDIRRLKTYDTALSSFLRQKQSSTYLNMRDDPERLRGPEAAGNEKGNRPR